MMMEGVRAYPDKRKIGGRDVTLRYMVEGDKPAMLNFARALPEHDLLFLRRDITQPARDLAYQRLAHRAEFRGRLLS